jgi:hypothetical protein
VRRAGRQDREAEGFDEVVVGAGVQAGDDVDVVGAGGEDDGQEVPEAGAWAAGGVGAVHVGQAEVQEQGVVGGAACFGEGGGAGAASGGGVTVASQAGLEMVADDVVVLGHEDSEAAVAGCAGRAHGRQGRHVSCRTPTHRSRSSSLAGRRVRRIPFRTAASTAVRAAGAVRAR